MRRLRAINCTLSLLLLFGAEALLADGAGTAGVVVLRSGTEVPFERIAPFSDFAGDYLRFTDESVEVDGALPSSVEVRIRDLRSLRVGKKIEKERHVPSTARTVTCQWLEIDLALANGESVHLRSSTSSESDAISACGGPTSLYVERGGVRRQIDLSSVKEIRFGVGRVERQKESSLTFDDISMVSIDPAQNEGYWSQGIDQAIGFQIIQGIPLFNSIFGRGPVVCSHPVSQDRPAIFNIKVNGASLRFAVRSHPSGDSKLEIWAGNKFLFGEIIDQKMSWKDISVEIPDNVQTVQLRHSATDWYYEFLYLDFKAELP